MGQPKQLVPVEGRPILERTLEQVRESAVDEIVLVLGFAADHRPFADFVMLAERNVRFHDGTRFEPATKADLGALFHQAEGTNRHVIAKLNAGLDDGGRMYVGHETVFRLAAGGGSFRPGSVLQTVCCDKLSVRGGVMPVRNRN